MKNGWKATRIGDVIVENPRSALKVRDSISGGEYPFYTSGASISSLDDYLCDGKNLFIATGGKACVQYYEGKAAYSTDCYSLTTRTDVIPKFLFYLLESLLTDIEENMFEGAALRHLQKTKFRDTVVPLPLRPEQQRIVGILDEAFEGIATAKVNAERNLHNARALFESHLQAVFIQRGPGWVEKRLTDIAKVFGRGKSKDRPRNKPTLYGGKYPFVQTGDISNANHRITSYSQTYSEDGLAQSKLWPKGTICIAIVGATVGETAILDFDACFPDSVIGIVVNERLADSEYVEYVLQSFKVILKEKGKGTARDNINLGTFEGQTFPFPTLDVQKKIVSVLNGLDDETQRLESIYQRKLDALEALKKRLLHQALTGLL